MPDNEYLRKVYDNLNHAYGSEGVVDKGALQSSFEDFALKMGNPEYAKKVYDNMDYAYGKNGVADKGALTSSKDQFLAKIYNSSGDFQPSRRTTQYGENDARPISPEQIKPVVSESTRPQGINNYGEVVKTLTKSLPYLKKQAIDNITRKNLEEKRKSEGHLLDYPMEAGSPQYEAEKANVAANIKEEDYIPSFLSPHIQQQAVEDFASANNMTKDDVESGLINGTYALEDGKVKLKGGIADNFMQGAKDAIQNIKLGLDVAGAKANKNTDAEANNEIKYHINNYLHDRRYENEYTSADPANPIQSGAKEAGGFSPYLAGGLVSGVSPALGLLDIPAMGYSNIGGTIQEIWHDPKYKSEEEKLNAIHQKMNDAFMIGATQAGAFHGTGAITEGTTANGLLKAYKPTSELNYKPVQSLYNNLGAILSVQPKQVAYSAANFGGTELLNELNKANSIKDVDWSKVPEAAVAGAKLHLTMQIPKVLTGAFQTLREIANTRYDKVDPQFYNNYSKQTQDALNALVTSDAKTYNAAMSQLEGVKDSDPNIANAKEKIETFRNYYENLPAGLSKEAKEKALHILQLKTEAISEAQNSPEQGIAKMHEARASKYDDLLQKLVQDGDVSTKEPLLIERFEEPKISVIKPEEVNKPQTIEIGGEEPAKEPQTNNPAIILPETNREPNVVPLVKEPIQTDEKATAKEDTLIQGTARDNEPVTAKEEKPTDTVIDKESKQPKEEVVGEPIEAKEKKSFENTYQRVNKLDPATDARGMALEYFAGGGKLHPESFDKETVATRKRYDNRGKSSGDARENGLVDKKGKTVDEITQSIWDNLPEHLQAKIEYEDIKNQVIDVAKGHDKRISAAKELLRRNQVPELDFIDPNELKKAESNPLAKVELDEVRDMEFSPEELADVDKILQRNPDITVDGLVKELDNFAPTTSEESALKKIIDYANRKPTESTEQLPKSDNAGETKGSTESNGGEKAPATKPKSEPKPESKSRKQSADTGSSKSVVQERKSMAAWLESKRLGKTTNVTIDFGLTKTIYNKALTFMADQVRKGTKLGDAIASAIIRIDRAMGGKKWDKAAFEKAMFIDLSKQEISKTSDGKFVVTDKETGEPISPLYKNEGQGEAFIADNKPQQDITKELAKEAKNSRYLEESIASKSFTDKIRTLAQDIRDGKVAGFGKGMEGVQVQGFGGKAFQEMSAKALEVFAEAIDRIGDFTKAVEEGFKVVREYFNENAKSWDETKVRSAYEKQAKELYDEWKGESGGAKLSGEKTVGITHAAMDNLSEEFGLSDRYEKNPKTVAEWDAEAKKRLDKGELPALVDKMEQEVAKSGKVYISDVEQRMLLQRVAALKSEYDKTKSDAVLEEFSRIKRLSDLVGQTASKVLRARQDNFGVHPLEGGLLSAMDYFKEVNGGKLTDKQKGEVEALVSKYQQEAETAKAELENLKNKYAEFLAKQNVDDAKKSTSTTTKKAKTKEDFVAERKSIIQSIKDKWKNAANDNTLTAVPVPYAKQLMAIAPDVAKLVRSYVEEGVDKLSDVVSKLKEEIESVIPEVTEKDIRDLIAGVYNEPKPTKQDILAKLHELQQEAKLLNEYERVLNHEPKTEKAKREKNRRLEEMRKKINDADIDSKLKRIIDANNRATAKLKERIKNGDFETKKTVPLTENEEFKKANRDLYNEALNAIHKKEEARHEFEMAAHKVQLENMDLKGKIAHNVTKLVRTIQSIKAGIDNSFMFVQAGATVLRNPRIGWQSIKEQAKDFAGADSWGEFIKNPAKVWSPDRFNRSIEQIHVLDEALGNIIKNSGLSILEPQSLLAKNKEEMFAPSYLDDKIKVSGKEFTLGHYTTKPFERLYTSLGNNLRVRLFLEKVKELQLQGITFENDPKAYKDLANAINNLTGRGSFSEGIAHTATNPVTTFFIWSPRMIASGLNLLGITDLAGLATGGKLKFYRGMSPKARNYALSQFIGGIGIGIGIMAAAKVGAIATGKGDDVDVDFDPRSTTFGNLKVNDISGNVFGRYASIVKLFVQSALGQKITTKGTEDLDASGGSSRAKAIGSFVRGKMTPTGGELFDFLNDRKNYYTNQPMKLSELPSDLIAPMSVQQIYQDFNKNGWTAFLRSPLVFSGVNIRDDKDFYTNKWDSEPIGKFLMENKTKLKEIQTTLSNNKNPDGKATDAEMKRIVDEKDKFLKPALEVVKDKGFYAIEDNKVVFKKGESITTKTLQDRVDKLYNSARELAKDKVIEKKNNWSKATNADNILKLSQQKENELMASAIDAGLFKDKKDDDLKEAVNKVKSLATEWAKEQVFGKKRPSTDELRQKERNSDEWERFKHYNY